MRSAKEDAPCRKKQPLDLVSAVKELHMLSTQELGKLIRDADNDTIQWTTSNGSSNQIDLDGLARYLALHLIAKLISSKQDEELFRYLLCGVRLMHTLCDVAPRYSKLDQVLLEDMTLVEQVISFVLCMIVVLGDYKQKLSTSNDLALLHSVLVASTLHLLTTSVSSQMHEIAQVFLVHPMGDMLIRFAFPAVHIDVQFLQTRLSAQDTDTKLAEVNRLCQHAEASLQFLQSLCHPRPFREHLIKTKELSCEFGILLLARDIMKLPFCEDSYLMAVVCRLKSKILSILLQLCDVETVSFLDVAASTTAGLNLAKSTIFQVLDLLKTMFRGDLNGLAAFSDKTYPRGLLQLNAMRLTEILSDDSNFRSYITLNFTEVLTTTFLVAHSEFMSNWCSSDSPPSEEDASLEFDSLAAAGSVLGVLPSSDIPESTFNPCRVPRTSYAFQRTSLLVKVVANLTCFIPDICKEEKDLFLQTFMECLQKLLPSLPYGLTNESEAVKAAVVRQNLRSLLSHAESLLSGYLNEDDVQLLRLFIGQLEPLITRDSNLQRVKEGNGRDEGSPDADQNKGISEDKSGMEQVKNLSINDDQRTGVAQPFAAARGVHVSDGADAQNLETNTLELNVMQQTEEKRFTKRKRNIMNYIQISMIEQALQNEPDMQRKAASIQLWADKLSLHGSEISASQLKNWLNNRKAKLARAAAKDVRPQSGGDSGFFDKQGGGSGTDPVSDSPESPDEYFDPTQTQHQISGFSQGQFVVVMDGQNEEIGKGFVHQARGVWSGTDLDESGLCVVDVTYLKVDKWTNLPHPRDGTGTTFGHAEQIHGVKRVLWESSKLVVQQKAR